jgi:hypothetical protein
VRLRGALATSAAHDFDGSWTRSAAICMSNSRELPRDQEESRYRPGTELVGYGGGAIHPSDDQPRTSPRRGLSASHDSLSATPPRLIMSICRHNDLLRPHSKIRGRALCACVNRGIRWASPGPMG